MTVRILIGDCRDVLKTLDSDSMHMCVTSPPYWGLRSYLPADHANKHLEIGSEPSLQEWVDTMVDVFREVRRVLRPDGVLFLNLGDAYAGSRRGPDTNSTLEGSRDNQAQSRVAQASMTASRRRDDEPIPRSDVAVHGLKPKDMMGQPWRVAFALQADGWYLRQEIIWSKPNPMPESARDRCTKAHEHVFLLSKSERYFYNFDAMQEPASPSTHARMAQNVEAQHGSMRANGGEQSIDGPDSRPFKAGGRRNNGVGFGHGYDEVEKARTVSDRPTSRASQNMGRGPGWRAALKAEVGAEVGYAEGKALRMVEVGRGLITETRNPRSVWTIPTHGFKGAHFATFPPALAERCITAGCPEGGGSTRPVRWIWNGRHGR